MFSAASNAVGYWLGWGQETKSQEPKSSSKQDSTADADASWEVVEHSSLTTGSEDSSIKQEIQLEEKKLDTVVKIEDKKPEVIAEILIDKKPAPLEILEETISLKSNSSQTPKLPPILPPEQRIEVVADGPIAEYQPHAEVKDLQKTTSAQLLDRFAELKVTPLEIDSPSKKIPSPRRESVNPEAKCVKTHPVIIKPQPDSPRDFEDSFTSCTGAFIAVREFFNDFFAGFFKPQSDVIETPKAKTASKRMVSI